MFFSSLNAAVSVGVHFIIPFILRILSNGAAICAYFGKYIRNQFATPKNLCSPIAVVGGCHSRIAWSLFNELKNMLLTKSVLSHPDLNKPFHLFTDASDLGLGVYLAQTDAVESEPMKMVACRSRSLH